MPFLVAWLLAVSMIFLGPKTFGTLDARLSGLIGAVLALLIGGCILWAVASTDSYYDETYWQRFGFAFHALVVATIALDVVAAVALCVLATSRARRPVGAVLAGTGVLSLPACLALLGIAMVGH